LWRRQERDRERSMNSGERVVYCETTDRHSGVVVSRETRERQRAEHEEWREREESIASDKEV